MIKSSNINFITPKLRQDSSEASEHIEVHERDINEGNQLEMTIKNEKESPDRKTNIREETGDQQGYFLLQELTL